MEERKELSKDEMAASEPVADHSDVTRRRAACEANYLLNEAIRELIAPLKVFELTRPWESRKPVPITAIGAVRHMVLNSLIINLYRLKETRDQFLCGWLFPDAELRSLGFPPVEEFIGGEKWNFFETIRHVYAGHATGSKSNSKRPGRIIPSGELGKAIREAGLWDQEAFLKRVVDHLVPGVEAVRDELTTRYPEVRDFVTRYGLELEQAAQASGSESV